MEGPLSLAFPIPLVIETALTVFVSFISSMINHFLATDGYTTVAIHCHL